jgi:hypothetical protein
MAPKNTKKEKKISCKFLFILAIIFIHSFNWHIVYLLLENAKSFYEYKGKLQIISNYLKEAHTLTHTERWCELKKRMPLNFSSSMFR